MKTSRTTAFVFACFGIATLLLTYACSIFVLQQMMYAIEHGTGDANFIIAIFLFIFAAASLLVIFVLPILPALLTLLFSLAALNSSHPKIRIISIVFISLCGLSLLSSFIGLLFLIF